MELSYLLHCDLFHCATTARFDLSEGMLAARVSLVAEKSLNNRECIALAAVFNYLTNLCKQAEVSE